LELIAERVVLVVVSLELVVATPVSIVVNFATASSSLVSKYALEPFIIEL
jgi:hypothetical protein